MKDQFIRSLQEKITPTHSIKEIANEPLKYPESFRKFAYGTQSTDLCIISIAKELGRHAIGYEINLKYQSITQFRLGSKQLPLEAYLSRNKNM